MSEGTGGNGAPAAAPASSGGESSGNADATSAMNTAVTREVANDNGAPATETTPEVEPWRKIKHKVVIDGAETEVPYEELVGNYQRRRVSQARFEEAARKEKAVRSLMQGLQTAAQKGDRASMRDFMRRLGYDPRQFAEAELSEIIRQEQLSPEQRRRSELEAKERAIRDAEEKLEAKQREARITAMQRKYEQDITAKLPAALQKAGVPQTSYHLRRIASLLQEQLSAGESPDLENAAAIVAEEYHEEMDAHLSALDVEALMKRIGDERMKEIRKRDLERLRSGDAPPSPMTREPASENGQRRAAKPMGVEEFFDRLRKGEL